MTQRANNAFLTRTVLGIVAAAGMFPALAHAQCPPTFTLSTVGMAGSPILTVVGDFNHDGILDLASPNFSGHDITVRFANPNFPAGTNFNPVVTLPVGLNPSSMFAGDLNADGVTDLAVGYINGGAPRIGVYISNGNGTFQTIANYAPTPQSTQIKAADVNHDGIVDIVASATNNLLVLPGHTGAWPGGGAEAFSVRPVAMVAASFFNTIDLNGDGALDMVTTGGDPGRVFLALGAPPNSETFGPTVTQGSGSVFGTGWPTAGDFNNDGIMDLVVTHQITNARVQIFLGSAGGTLTAMPVVITGGASPRCPAVADFNGDGMLDVACVHNGGVGVHLGNGLGGLTNATNFTVSQATTLTTADMNNDGRPDIIASSQTLGSFTILMNTTPVTTFTTAPTSARVCPGGGSGAQFTAAATSTQPGGVTGYRWERLVGSSWQQLTDGALAGVGTIAGALSQHLSVGGVQGNEGDTVMLLRAVAVTSCGGNPGAPVSLSIIRPCGGADVGATGGVYTGCGDGVLDNNDFVVYIDLFFNGNVIADLGSQGGVPGADGQFNNNDFVVFIDLFFSGCPA